MIYLSGGLYLNLIIPPRNFSNATIQYVRAKAKGDGSIYDLTYEIDGHILDIQFPANKQKRYWFTYPHFRIH